MQHTTGEMLLALDHYSYRRDWPGVTKDGKYWRYFGAPSFFETYEADPFDKILDGICFQSNNRL